MGRRESGDTREDSPAASAVYKLTPMPKSLPTLEAGVRTAFLAAGLAAAGWTLPLASAPDPEVFRLLSEWHVPSASVAQIKGGRVVRARAYGQQSSSVAATSDTLYNLASLTKPISAEVVLRLVSKGVLSLDEPMHRYWTDPDIASDERRKLLTPTNFAEPPDRLCELALRDRRRPQLQNRARKGFGYSGEGYEYLARFVEKKTGKNLEEHARELVFTPARMRVTAYTRQPWFDGRVAVPADAEGRWLKPTFADKPVASDLMYTTAVDYAQFLLQVMKDEGLTQSVASQRSRVQISLREKMCQSIKAEVCPDGLGMGLGWQVLRFKKKTVFMHTGRDPGVYTFTYLCPTTGSGAVILTNGENGNKVVVPLLQRLAAEPEFVEFLAKTMR